MCIRDRGVVALAENASLAKQLSLPYGLGADVWAAVVDRSGDLNEALSGGDSDLTDVEIEEMATNLHDLMRGLV